MIGIIGGTGFAEYEDFERSAVLTAATPYGEVYLEQGTLAGKPLVFLPRHGHPPQFPPHKINYRANIQALADMDVDGIVAINAVGGVDPALPVPSIVIPDQMIDYTWGRAHTFFDEAIHHIDFTDPFDGALRQALTDAAPGDVVGSGTYGCTQGPRLETAAEIKRLRQDGCDIVGMTAMPEAVLARERNLPYASCCVVVNCGAGIAPISHDEIRIALQTGMAEVRRLLSNLIARY